MRISADHRDDIGDAGEHECLSNVLARSAAELADLIQQCAALGGDATQDMQALDWIAQHLEGLSSFLDALAVKAGPGWRLDTTDALDALSLAELAHRLRGGAAPSVTPLMSSGDMELF